LFRIDPRIQGNKLVESQFKQYATKNDFSAAATTESGKVALASNKGDIRLFDQIGKNAKVRLPLRQRCILALELILPPFPPLRRLPSPPWVTPSSAWT
jgi:hypothetical protein